MHCLFITPVAFRSKPSTLKLSIKNTWRLVVRRMKMSVTCPPRVVHCLKSFQEGGVIMKLTIYFDGSFWCGLVEVEDNGHYQAIRHVFGPRTKGCGCVGICDQNVCHIY